MSIALRERALPAWGNSPYEIAEIEVNQEKGKVGRKALISCNLLRITSRARPNPFPPAVAHILLPHLPLPGGAPLADTRTITTRSGGEEGMAVFSPPLSANWPEALKHPLLCKWPKARWEILVILSKKTSIYPITGPCSCYNSSFFLPSTSDCWCLSSCWLDQFSDTFQPVSIF